MSIQSVSLCALREIEGFAPSPFLRGFVWESERVEDFFLQIQNAFSKDRKMFLGNVLVYEEEGVYKILDGWQRIVICKMILDLLEGSERDWSENERSKQALAILKSKIAKIGNKSDFERFFKEKLSFSLTQLKSQSNLYQTLLRVQNTKKAFEDIDILKARFLRKFNNSRQAKIWQKCKRVCDRGVVGFSWLLLIALELCNFGDKIEGKGLLEAFEGRSAEEIEAFFERLEEVSLYLPRRDSEGVWGLEEKLEERLGEELEEKWRGEYIKLFSYLAIARSKKSWGRILKEFLAFVIEQSPPKEDLIPYLERLDNLRCKKHKEWGFLNRGVEVLHYWFYRLDYYLYKNRERYRDIRIGEKSFAEIAESYEFRRLNSIEHIQPQSRASEGDWSKKSKNIFGNLALISQNFNSSLNAKSVKEKKRQIIKQIKEGKVESLKMVLAYAEIEEVWSLQMAEEHQNKMIKILEDSLLYF
ncbi:GmrSD restriction endonuclease domain-containing protein [Helicobacter brantae]|uniref:DUF262 domain-containing protein n=1 Tax=Helicobacter brantae TaxID=375927 RepID=A0A3D8IYE9_9HELI|nr:DUF1524 domain-containing protein [Helicobacter brantae]RDU70292.1 hypothetical protein CQA58_06095 [Helicobacter brantae]